MLGSPRLEATNQMNQKRSKMFHVLVAAGRSLLSSSAEDWQRINLFLPENKVRMLRLKHNEDNDVFFLRQW